MLCPERLLNEGTQLHAHAGKPTRGSGTPWQGQQAGQRLEPRLPPASGNCRQRGERELRWAAHSARYVRDGADASTRHFLSRLNAGFLPPKLEASLILKHTGINDFIHYLSAAIYGNPSKLLWCRLSLHRGLLPF